MASGEDFSPEICKIRHETIDKDIDEIKEDVEKTKREVKINYVNLKNKIILVNKSMGDKIDDLNDFDKGLRGNGDPGIWEAVRGIKKDVKIIMILLIVFIGGSVGGISIKTVRDKWFGPKTKQVEPVLKEIEAIPKGK